MTKKDKNDREIHRYLDSLNYECKWSDYSSIDNIKAVLSKASKKCNNENGYPDSIYENEEKRLLILVEIKPQTSQHQSELKNDPGHYAVDGILHYLSFFTNEKLENDILRQYFKSWKIIGIAISGDLKDEYRHRIGTFRIIDDKIDEEKLITDILDEEDYINLFENTDEEAIIEKVAESSKKINKKLRSINSQKRPILLSALMVCLFDKEGHNDFKQGYNGWDSETIAMSIPLYVKRILSTEGIPNEKIDLITMELEFLKVEDDMKNTNILKDILNELNDSIIPLFKRKTNYDIIGKFYEEFLRYAGVANVKKGIVLTPKHITSLFTDLIDIKTDDVIFDPACGTGSFLISGMNKIIDEIKKSDVPNKEEKIRNVKSNQLIGFEKDPMMYALAVSNMLFRGDGKSKIFFCNFFSKYADQTFKSLKTQGIQPTIGFVNPPYSGKGNDTDPTKPEIDFLIRMLDHVSRYGVIIAPVGVFIKSEYNDIRESILKKHTLKYVINMPPDLFSPNATTLTAIAVFETNKPHKDQEVIFCDLTDDGFVLSKSKGRTDVYNKWGKIHDNLIDKIKNPDRYNDGIQLVKTKINHSDEWIFQAHCKTDFTDLNEEFFINNMKKYMIYQAKKEMNLLNQNIDEVTLLDILSEHYSKKKE